MFSLSNDKKFFYYALGGMFFLHCLILGSKLRKDFIASAPALPEMIKLRILQESSPTKTETKRQIVQSEDSATEKKSENAFLSDKDRFFERESVSKRVDKFKKAAKGDSKVTQREQNLRQAAKLKALKDLRLSDIGIMETGAQVQKAQRTPASAMKQGMKNGDEESFGLSATNDYVEEIQTGDFTYLNTVEYKYYGFYHRIRLKLEQFWGNSLQEKAANIFRAGRRLPASENLVTSLRVTLNEKGEIIGVKVIGASGVKELDDAAIESFNQAGPFPNPPKGLLKNGKAEIEWGFVVKS